MNEKSIVQYAEVEQPFGSEPPLVHCPICGEAPLKENEIVPCKHLSFIFVGEVCEFEYKSDQFKEKISQITNDQAYLSQIIKNEILIKYYYKKGLFQNKLTKDKVILEAVKILKNKNKYAKILKEV